MKEICTFEIDSRPVAWRLIKKNGRKVFTKTASEFMALLKTTVLEEFPITFRISSKREFELVISIFEIYDRKFNDPEGNKIPDLDHVSTLIMNTFKGIFYQDDIEVSSLSIHRWKIDRNETERIKISVYQL